MQLEGNFLCEPGLTLSDSTPPSLHPLMQETYFSAFYEGSPFNCPANKTEKIVELGQNRLQQ